jgi:hypothetical protein
VGEAPIATWDVKRGGSIQDAIAAAEDGDVIRVSQGTYPGVLHVLGRSLALVSRCPRAAVLDGQQLGLPVVTYDGGAAGSLTGFTIQGGVAVDGGGVFISDASPRLVGNHIRSNQATRDGGGIFMTDLAGVVLLEQNTVEGNTAGRHGGALAWSSSQGVNDIVLASNVWVRNTAEEDGGALYLDALGDTRIDDSTFSENRASRGGAAAVSGLLTLERSVLERNEAMLDGGGLWFTRSTVTMTGNQFSDNAAQRGGGAVLADSSELVLDASTFEGNRATDGGGLHLEATGASIKGNDWLGNTADMDGGALFVQGADDVAALVSTGNLFQGNAAAQYGGALILRNSEAALPSVFETDVWTENIAEEGGAMYLSGHAVWLDDVTVTGNEAMRGGGIAGVGWVGQLLESAVSGNRATDAGAGVWLTSSSALRVWSNVFHDNVVSAGGAGGAIWVSSEAVVLGEDDEPWLRQQAPLCGQEVTNDYGELAPNTPDDVMFEDSLACD